MTGRKGPYLMMPRELSVASEHSLCVRSWTNSVFFIFLMGCVSLTAGTRVCGSDQVVVVCPPEFTNSLNPWVRLRKAQGCEVVVVRPVADAGETKKLVRQAFSNLKRSNSSIPDHSPVGDSIAKRSAESSRFLFLLGDTPPIGAVCDLTRQVPTFYQPADVTAKWGSTPTLPSDFPYSDLDNDGNPDATDLNPLTPVVTDDVLTVVEGTTGTVNVLTNDDFVPGSNTSLVNAGGGTAGPAGDRAACPAGSAALRRRRQ